MTEDAIVRLRAAFLEILDEAEANPTFARNLERALGATNAESARAPRRGARRAPGVLDPFAIYSDGEQALRDALGRLSVEELKDIVAEHGMDQSKLAMKWKSTDRLMDFIITTVGSRARKGRAFLTSGTRRTRDDRAGEGSHAPMELGANEGESPDDDHFGSR